MSPVPDVATLWARLTIEELRRAGVGYFSLSPGSRSTPLLLAVAASGARRVMHVDERGSAFFALGYARATGRPAAWITTSGTAVANGLPAVVEASIDDVPMLCLTADRPPELRDSGANQTIEQTRIFGGHARWFADVPVADPAIDPAFVLTTIDQAVHRATRRVAGPVHLNMMFREPLAPVAGARAEMALPPHLHPWEGATEPYTSYVQSVSIDADSVAQAADALARARRGVVVLGRSSRTEAAAALRLAVRLNWPLLPDITSPLRLGPSRAGVVPHHDLLLSAPDIGALQPEAAIIVGGRFVSAHLQRHLGRRVRPLVAIRRSPARQDPLHRVTHHIEGSLDAACDALASVVRPRSGDDEWRGAWVGADALVRRSLQSALDECDEICEPGVARAISTHVPEGHGLFLGSSMPVRDVDTFGLAGGAAVVTGANRGASGIDGTVASAAGFAAGLERPVTLLLGDLALLHDLNALALLREHVVVLVVVNNDGGGIFSFLPIAEHAEVFEPFFGTPHGLSFEHAAAMFGLPYARPSTMSELVTAYRTALGSGRSSVIEVVTRRDVNRRRHAELRERVAAALGAPA